MIRILEQLDRIDQRLIHQGDLICALQHSSEVAKAEREAMMLALARSGGQMAEMNRMTENISKRICTLASVQEAIKENLKDQSLDITLLKKVISM